jgi:hypothetical protein
VVEDSRDTLAWLVGEMVKNGCGIASLDTHVMKFEDVLVKLIEGNNKTEEKEDLIS